MSASAPVAKPKKKKIVLPPLSPAESRALIADWLEHHSPTPCPTVFANPSQAAKSASPTGCYVSPDRSWRGAGAHNHLFQSSSAANNQAQRS
jgi:hypothetical protein